MNFLKKISIILVSISLQISVTAQVSFEAFSYSGTMYNSGFGYLGVVGTENNVQSATFTNPCRMFDKDLAVDLSIATNVHQFSSTNDFHNISGHKVFGKQAFGIYSKISFQDDYVFKGRDLVTGAIIPIDTFFEPTTNITGLAYAYQLNDKWSIGGNLNHYLGTYGKNKRLAEADFGKKRHQGLTLGIAVNYKEEIKIGEKTIVKLSFGTSINDFGAKNSNYEIREKMDFMWTTGNIGLSFGFERLFKKSSLQLIALNQSTMSLTPDYSDKDGDGVVDRYGMSALKGVFVAPFDDPFDQTIAEMRKINSLELMYKHQNSIEIGCRFTTEDYGLFGGHYYALTLGYHNFYANVGSSSRTNLNTPKPLGISVGYQTNLSEN